MRDKSRAFLENRRGIPLHQISQFSCSTMLSYASQESKDDKGDEKSYSYGRTEREVQMARDLDVMIRATLDAVDPATAVSRRLELVELSEVDALDYGDITAPRREDPETGMKWSNHALRVDGARLYPLRNYDRIVLVGFGKASAAMAVSVLQVLSFPYVGVSTGSCASGHAADAEQSDFQRRLPRLSGLVIVKDGHATAEQVNLLQRHGVDLREASHPVPDARSAQASMDLLRLVQQRDPSSDDSLCTEDSDRKLVICCISGGGSSLFCAPRPPLTLKDLQETNQVLLQSGWNIQGMNTVRKQLELGKGGRLAAAAHPCHFISLILSDVVGDPLDLIASGPTVPSSGTPSDAWNLLRCRPLPPDLQLPPRVIEMLKDDHDKVKSKAGGDDFSLLTSSGLPPTAEHPVFRASYTSLVGSNVVAVQAAADTAAKMGYHPVILTTQMSGEASQVAPLLVSFAHHLQSTAQASNPLRQVSTTSPPTAGNAQFRMVPALPAALILGGETTVTLPPDCQGVGGRNQELGLQGAVSMHSLGMRNVVMASIGTDGGDGPTDAAGAIVDGGMIERFGGLATASKALQRHDAYTYLNQQDSDGWSALVKTGPTGTNVADVCILLVHE
jgi:glycerate-2-kinase